MVNEWKIKMWTSRDLNAYQNCTYITSIVWERKIKMGYLRCLIVIRGYLRRVKIFWMKSFPDKSCLKKIKIIKKNSYMIKKKLQNLFSTNNIFTMAYFNIFFSVISPDFIKLKTASHLSFYNRLKDIYMYINFIYLQPVRDPIDDPHIPYYSYTLLNYCIHTKQEQKKNSRKIHFILLFSVLLIKKKWKPVPVQQICAQEKKI